MMDEMEKVLSDVSIFRLSPGSSRTLVCVYIEQSILLRKQQEARQVILLSKRHTLRPENRVASVQVEEVVWQTVVEHRILCRNLVRLAESGPNKTA